MSAASAVQTAVLFVVAAVVSFAPAVTAPFAFDDTAAIATNPSIRRAWPVATALSPPAGTAMSGRPVVNYTLALNYALNEALGVRQAPTNVAPFETVTYHIVSIGIHVINALLLLLVLRRTLEVVGVPSRWNTSPSEVATITCLIWLVHPIQTEAVDYPTQRTELIVSMFYLAVLYTAIRAWDAAPGWRRTAWSAVSVGCCALGMGSKEVMATAPLAVLLYDRTFNSGSSEDWKALLRRRFPLYVALWSTLILLALAIAGDARAGSVGFHGRTSWIEYLTTQGWAIWRYLRLLIFPAGLTLDYGQRAITGLAPRIGLGLLAIAAIGAFVAWRRRRWLGFAGAWFFLLLAPSSSVIPIQTEVAAERRVYLAIASPILLVVLESFALLNGRKRQVASNALQMRVVVWTALICVLAGLASWRSGEYRDPAVLWSGAIARYPGNARVYDNLASVLIQRDTVMVDSARKLVGKAIEVDSLYISGWTNLALLENARHNVDGARALLERAVQIDPDAVVATRDLGLLLSDLGKAGRAIPYLERVAGVTKDPEVLHALGSSYAATGRYNEAVATLISCVGLDRTRVDAIELLATLLVEAGESEDALRYLDLANAQRAPTIQVLALSSLAKAQLARGDAAVADAVEASRRGVSDPRLLNLLGRSMVLVHRLDAAEEFFSVSLRLDASNAETPTALAIIAAARGQIPEAERLFRRALAIDSSYAAAQAGLSRLRR